MRKAFRGLFLGGIVGIIAISTAIAAYANNSMSEAAKLDVNDSVSDNISERDEKDYYYFDLQNDGIITLIFKHENFTKEEKSWNIVLYDENSNELYSFDSYQNKPNTSSCSLGLAQGTYYVLVKRADYCDHHDGDYTLELDFEESNEWESEHNNSYKEANIVNVNSQYNGTICNRDDKDYYRFSLDNDGVIDINFKHENFTEKDKSWEITLYNENSDEIYTFCSCQNEITVDSCNLGLSAGEYFMCIKRADYNELHQGDYEFEIKYSENNYWEKELNENVKDATELVLDTDFKGCIRDRDDKDYFQINIGKSGIYNIDFLHDNFTDDEKSWCYTLYDETSNVIATQYSRQNQKSSRLRSGAIDAGKYYICVKRNDYNDLCDEDYTLNISEANRKEILMHIDNPKFSIEGKTQDIDSSGTVPVVVDGRTLVPIRAIIEGMGGTVEWDASSQKVTLTYYSDEIQLYIGKTRAYINGSSETLDVAPKTINDRTMLPIRFISETFGCNVDWNGSTQAITIEY